MATNSAPRSSRSAMMALPLELRRMLCALSCWRSAYLMVLRGVRESKTSFISSALTIETLAAWCRAYDGNDALDDLGRKSPR